MADNIRTFKTSCVGGLVTGFDVFSQAETAPGGAVRLINYEPSFTGGYRRIDGYVNDYSTVDGTGKVLGVAVNDGLNDGIFAWRKSTGAQPSYFYRWNKTSSVWQSITSPASPTSNVSKIRSVNVRWGVDKLVFVDGVNFAQVYNGTTCSFINGGSAPASPRFITLFANHLFLAGTASEPYNLYFSAPLNESDFTPANGAGVINVGFEITQIKSFRDELFIFGENQIKRLIGNNAANFELKDVTTNLGCVIPDSVVEVAGNLLFLSRDGFRPVSGTERIGDIEIASTSPQIKDKVIQLFAEITGGSISPDSFTSVTVNAKTQFRLLTSSASIFGFIGGIRQTVQGTGFEYGQLYDIVATCAASGYINLEEYVIHGDIDGKVYRQEKGNSFDGRSIFSVFQTPYQYMDDPVIRKNFYKLHTFLRTNGSANIALGVSYDYEDTVNVYNPTNYAITSSGAAAFYNNAVYNASAIFDGNPSPVNEMNIEGSGFSVSFRYVAFDTNPSHTIQNYVVEYTLNDRR